MKILFLFTIVFSFSAAQAFDLEEILGCHRTLKNNSYPAQKSEYYIEHITKDHSRFLFDLNGNPLPVLDFILGSYMMSMDAHHGDWVLKNIQKIDKNTLEINFSDHAQVKFKNRLRPTQIQQKLRLQKIRRGRFKVWSDQTIFYDGRPDRSQQNWVIKRISCP